jgi:hypothetical protein
MDCRLDGAEVFGTGCNTAVRGDIADEPDTFYYYVD